MASSGLKTRLAKLAKLVKEPANRKPLISAVMCGDRVVDYWTGEPVDLSKYIVIVREPKREHAAIFAERCKEWQAQH